MHSRPTHPAHVRVVHAVDLNQPQQVAHPIHVQPPLVHVLPQPVAPVQVVYVEPPAVVFTRPMVVVSATHVAAVPHVVSAHHVVGRRPGHHPR